MRRLSRSGLGLLILVLLALAAGCATLRERGQTGDAAAAVAEPAAGRTDTRVPGIEEQDPLHVAVLIGERPLARALLEAGFLASDRAGQGATPLHYWALGRHRDAGLAEELLAAGASVRAQADDGSSPLHWAAGREIRRPESDASRRPFRELLDEGDRSGLTPLGWAPSAGLGVTMVDVLLPPLDLLAAAAVQRTPGAVENVAFLLAAGADARARDDAGGTPLHWAAAGDASLGVVTALLSAGAYAGALDDNWNTPLHWAAGANASLEVVQALLSAGANAAAENAAGAVPADLAAPGSVLRPLLAANQLSPLNAPDRAPPEPGGPPVDSQGRPIYRMRVTIHGVDGCGDDSGGAEYYAVIEREDAEVLAEFNATFGATMQVVGSTTGEPSPWDVLGDLERHEAASRLVPLAEAEQQYLEQLRQAQDDLSGPQRAEMNELARREALSPVQARRLRVLRTLHSQWRSQLNQLRMLEGFQGRNRQGLRNFLQVYPDDVLRISLHEADVFEDDNCFDTTVVLEPAALVAGLLEIRHLNQVALTLRFSH